MEKSTSVIFPGVNRFRFFPAIAEFCAHRFAAYQLLIAAHTQRRRVKYSFACAALPVSGSG